MPGKQRSGRAPTVNKESAADEWLTPAQCMARTGIKGAVINRDVRSRTLASKAGKVRLGDLLAYAEERARQARRKAERRQSREEDT